MQKLIVLVVAAVVLAWAAHTFLGAPSLVYGVVGMVIMSGVIAVLIGFIEPKSIWLLIALVAAALVIGTGMLSIIAVPSMLMAIAWLCFVVTVPFVVATLPWPGGSSGTVGAKR